MDKYKEALEKARAEYEKAREQGYTWLMNLLEGMFPDLKEGEDERIRKWLIEEIKATHDYDSPTSKKCVDDALAYLERQKEQKFTEKQDYSDLTDLERAIHRGFLVVGVENVPVTIIKETAQDCLAQMNPAEWSDEDEKMRQRIIRHIESEYQDWCKDKYGNSEIVSDGKESCRERIAWLKSLKNRGDSPKSNTNSPSWSEEDDKTLNRIINVLDTLGYEEYCTSSRDQDVEEERLYYNEIQVLKKLKSLRPPQYCENCKLKRSVENWKPSKEQMGMLLAVINDPNNAGAESCHLMLQSLYADLEKL